MIETTPPDAVVQLRIEGNLPPGTAGPLGAASLREMAGERHLALGGAASWRAARAGARDFDAAPAPP